MKNTIIAAVLGTLFVGSASAASAVDNGSFEASSVASNSFAYAGTVVAAPWVFGGYSGIVNGSSTPWGGNALDGSSFAFLQQTSSISQTFSANSGQYVVSFALAQRTGYSLGQTVSVVFNGTALTANALQPSSDGNWTSFSFAVGALAGDNTLAFNGLLNTGVDSTVFVDKVSVMAAVPEPESYAMLLAGLGLMGCIARRRSRAG